MSPEKHRPGRGPKLRFAAVVVLYCLGCWGLLYWGGLEAVGYERPYPWIGAVALELPLSLVVVATYVVLSTMSVGETLGTVMGFVLLLLLVAAPVGNVFVLRRLWRRWRPRADR